MESNKTEEQMSNDSLWVRLRDFVKGYFDLSSDLDDEKMAEEAVMDGVSFKGANISYFYCFIRAEHQFGCGDNRSHAHFAAYGPYHRYGIRIGNLRF